MIIALASVNSELPLIPAVLALELLHVLARPKQQGPDRFAPPRVWITPSRWDLLDVRRTTGWAFRLVLLHHSSSARPSSLLVSDCQIGQVSWSYHGSLVYYQSATSASGAEGAGTASLPVQCEHKPSERRRILSGGRQGPPCQLASLGVVEPLSPLAPERQIEMARPSTSES